LGQGQKRITIKSSGGTNLGEGKNREDNDAMTAHGHGLNEPLPTVYSA
jgi:hypothetical protein